MGHHSVSPDNYVYHSKTLYMVVRDNGLAVRLP